ncbi:C2 calcium-dependent domain-containing protein 4D [Chelonoidis abingdonii]|uniref:C2 calcium-dependent domain-containing protein 4D n=1 Tax=Chelonoidis abingdonii TaxID=106734 RepID=UPI0013F29AAF|nr:C2 calcium-dependent domain-containing protein 4D [Chelonoidis abingdonii]
MFLSRPRATNRKPGPLPTCPNVLTPDRIPKFFIPPKLSTLYGRALGGSPGSQQSPQGTGSLETHKALIRAADRHVTHAQSLHQDPMARAEGEAGHQLPPACSMSHLVNPGGFLLLPESPHTRRRESLFHSMCPPHHISLDLSPEPGARLLPPELRPWRPVSQPDALDSDTASSAGSSPFSFPVLGHPLACQAHWGRPLCSRTLDAQAGGRASSLSAEEASSTDDSPSFPRRQTEPSWGAVARLAPPPFSPLDFICRPARVAQENTVALSRGGCLRLSSKYVPASWCLHVRLVSAEGLYPRPCDPQCVGCCVALQLQPGKAQKQRSAVVKRSRSPIFNEDFFFEGLAPHELPARRLRLKAVNKGCGMRQDAVLGKAEVPLPALLPP